MFWPAKIKKKLKAFAERLLFAVFILLVCAAVAGMYWLDHVRFIL